ncbi:MAG: FlgD immunoglobulin-like domain containing protein, partial [Bacteroidota bacterium]
DGSTTSWTESSTFTTGLSASSVLAVTASAQPLGSGAAQITLKLTSASSVQATVYNMAGRPVAALPSRDLPAGVSTLTWSGKSDTGAMAPRGRYLVRVIAHNPDGSSVNCLAPLTR